MTQSVGKIKELVVAIRAALAGIEIPEDLVAKKYGHEHEYTCASIVAQIETNIEYVDSVVNEDTVVHIPHATRNVINHALRQINDGISIKNWEAMWQGLESLKKSGRYLMPLIFLDSDKTATDLSTLLAKKAELAAGVKTVEQQVDSLTKTLEFVQQQKKELESGSAETNQALAVLKNGVESATANVNTIAQHKATAEQQAALVGKHLVEASETEAKLAQQSSQTEDLLKKNAELQAEIQSSLGNAVVLGVSNSFLSRYYKAQKENRWPGMIWLFLSGLFIAAAIWLNIHWFVNDEPVKNVYELLSRISLTSLLVAGAWFCAGQYTKGKNIVEDYAYKAMLANSLVGVSEQLKGKDGADTASYREYMHTVLREIHQHPLKNHKKADSSGALAETVKALEKRWKNCRKNKINEHLAALLHACKCALGRRGRLPLRGLGGLDGVGLRTLAAENGGCATRPIWGIAAPDGVFWAVLAIN